MKALKERVKGLEEQLDASKEAHEKEMAAVNQSSKQAIAKLREELAASQAAGEASRKDERARLMADFKALRSGVDTTASAAAAFWARLQQGTVL